jgi:putative transport protein
MTWVTDLLGQESVAQTILIYCIVIAAGVSLGRMKILGVSLGIAFVLFAGIATGHLGFSVNRQVIDFIRDFGLILFVFSIGLQVGPGFFSSFRKGGLTLNLLAMAIVVTGGLTALVIHLISGTSVAVMAGIMSGAVTNTPGLGAAQQALVQVWPEGSAGEMPDLGLGYAVAYPFGVLGIILTMVLIRRILGINITKELQLYKREKNPEEALPERVSILVTNPQIFDKTIPEISGLIGRNLIITRVLHKGELYLASSDTVIRENDIILVVTQKGLKDEIVRETGVLSEMDLTAKAGRLISRRLMVTNRQMSGKRLGSLKLRTRYNINITRIYRSGIELIASPQLRLQMGDRLTVVGDEESIERVTGELGNSIKHLNEPNLVPLFIGILLGILLGSIPITLPGLAHPIKLGLAGGPLIVAILLSRYGYRFSLVSYTTPSANLMIREMGIVLFLASVGMLSGEKFIPALLSGDGFVWMGYGAIITLIPLFIVGFYARSILKRNYFEICGLLAGSTTDPPALAFANSIAHDEAPSIAYATVYPLVMFLRIFVAQAMIILFL